MDDSIRRVTACILGHVWGPELMGRCMLPTRQHSPSSAGFAGFRPKESRLRRNSPPAAAVGGAPTSSLGFCQVVGAHFILKGGKATESPASSVGRA